MAAPPILNPSDPHPVRRYCPSSVNSPFLLVGDHAGGAIPAALGDLGLSEEERQRHIAIDIGVEALGKALAERLGAVFLSQTYSRLVVDCNRAPEDPGWVAEESDGTVVPGNFAPSMADRAARRVAIYEPYHTAIADELDLLQASGADPVLISLHSFTPVMAGKPRPWEIGVLHNGHRDDFARGMLRLLRETPFEVGDNEPYRMDTTDYTVPHHAFGRGLRYVELEVRQDLLVENRNEVAARLSPLFLQLL